MSVLTKVGTFDISLGTSVQQITGLGFQPKAIIFWGGQRQYDSGYADGAWYFEGITSGPAEQFSVAFADKNGVNPTVAARRHAAKAISILNYDQTVEWEASLTSFDADGFTLTWSPWSNVYNGPRQISYLAIGGSDITNAKAVAWQTLAGTGSKTVTGVGFKPEFVYNISAFYNVAAPQTVTNIYFMHGAFNDSGQQFFDSIQSQHNVNPSDTQRVKQYDAAVGYVKTDLSLGIQMHYAQMTNDGFELFQSTGDAATQYVFSLCLKGLSSKISNIRRPSGTGSATQTVTKTGFKPRAVLFSHTEGSAISGGAANGYLTVGAIDRDLDCFAAGFYSRDAQTPAAAKTTYYESDGSASIAPLVTMGSFGSLDGLVNSVFNLDNDGFSFTWFRSVDNPHDIAYICLGDDGVRPTPSFVDSIGDQNATQFQNSRLVDRNADGTIWVTQCPRTGTTGPRWFYSKDGGQTWSLAATNLNSDGLYSHLSFYIDQDDYAHLFYKKGSDSFLRYRRGTPNGGRTDYSWSAATTVYSATTAGFNPDVVAHREGTGWKAHLVFGFQSGATTQVYYARINITSGHVITIDSAAAAISANYGTQPLAPKPSIDFRHTGDGKTIQAATPHLYIGWLVSATGAGFGLRFRKSVYAAGPTWTLNTEREITNIYKEGSTYHEVVCLYDGTRVVLAGTALDAAGTRQVTLVFERDEGDTATTSRVEVNDLTAGWIEHNAAGVTVDSSQNVYIIGGGTGGGYISLFKWDRLANTYSWTGIEPQGFNSPVWVSARRSGIPRMEWVYTQGNQNPYNIMYDQIIPYVTKTLTSSWDVTDQVDKTLTAYWQVQELETIWTDDPAPSTTWVPV